MLLTDRQTNTTEKTPKHNIAEFSVGDLLKLMNRIRQFGGKRVYLYT